MIAALTRRITGWRLSAAFEGASRPIGLIDLSAYPTEERTFKTCGQIVPPQPSAQLLSSLPQQRVRTVVHLWWRDNYAQPRSLNFTALLRVQRDQLISQRATTPTLRRQCWENRSSPARHRPHSPPPGWLRLSPREHFSLVCESLARRPLRPWNHNVIVLAG